MPKRKFPSTKFYVTVSHPKTGNALWVGHRADAKVAVLAARLWFEAAYGFLPTQVVRVRTQAMVDRSRQFTPLMAAVMAAAAAWQPQYR